MGKAAARETKSGRKILLPLSTFAVTPPLITELIPFLPLPQPILLFTELNRHGRIQNILATHGYENTDWFFNMVLCAFMVKGV